MDYRIYDRPNDGLTKNDHFRALLETAYLRGYGFVRVFRIVPTNGDTADAKHWASSDLQMRESTRQTYATFAWGIEQYHRGLKQHCGVERAQVRAARARPME